MKPDTSPRRHGRSITRLSLGLALSMLLAACNPLSVVQPAAPSATPASATDTAIGVTPAPATTASTTAPAATAGVVAGDQPLLLRGAFDYTNDILATYYVEHAVALVDMYGFVKRDQEWEIPVAGQTLGYLKLDTEQRHGEFELQLPAQPRGTPVDVDHDNQSDAGVQVFVVAYWPNLAGGPFSEGDDRSRGWPSYLASTVNDSNRHDEVVGGKLVVWAPDAQQRFPSGWGADGLLFTDDDPLQTLPAGWSVIDLDSEPFAIQREAEPELRLYEPEDLALKDFSALSYTEAFDRMFEIVRREYAFNGVPNKAPDWDQLRATIRPRIEQAERQRDAKAFYRALLDFTLAFKDGHVGINGGDYAVEVFRELAAGGYGFALRELDDGRFIVVDVTPDGPAARAGMVVGAEVTAFNNQPMAQAVSQVVPPEGPFSTDFARRYQQVRYLTRAPIGTQASVTFRNPGATPQTVTLQAVPEFQSLQATSLYRDYDPNALPVEFTIRASGVGYVRINSNYDDLNLIIRLFERALRTFQQNELDAVIIDLRRNSGGAPLGLAGFLTDQTITLGQLQYFSDATGTFEPEGPPQRVEPNTNQYRFAKLALLVDQACYSACELEAYAFSQVPGMQVFGHYPTAGVEAEVARGQFELPAGISLQVPTGRFVLPDGSIFLEGTGVQPTQRVPITEQTVLSDRDAVLEAAEQALTTR